MDGSIFSGLRKYEISRWKLIKVLSFPRITISRMTLLTTAIVLVLKHLTQQRNTHSKSATETLKKDVKSVKS